MYRPGEDNLSVEKLVPYPFVSCYEQYNMIDWLVFNVQRAIFQLYSGREQLKI